MKEVHQPTANTQSGAKCLQHLNSSLKAYFCHDARYIFYLLLSIYLKLGFLSIMQCTSLYHVIASSCKLFGTGILGSYLY